MNTYVHDTVLRGWMDARMNWNNPVDKIIRRYREIILYLLFFGALTVSVNTICYELVYEYTLTESKVMARPCVIFNIPNLDMIREGQGMIVVPQGDIQSATDAATEILTDHGKWLRLSREARESARKLCSFDYPGKWKTIFQSVSQRQKASQNAPPEIMVHVLANDLTVGYQNEAADLQWRDVRILELEDWCTQQDGTKAWLNDQIQNLQVQLQQRDDQIQNCHSESKWLKAQNQSLANRNQELQTWSDQQASQIEELQSAMDELQKDKTRLEEQHQALCARNRELQAWSDKQALQIAGLQHLKSLLEKQNLTLEAMVNLYRDQKHALEESHLRFPG